MHLHPCSTRSNLNQLTDSDWLCVSVAEGLYVSVEIDASRQVGVHYFLVSKTYIDKT